MTRSLVVGLMMLAAPAAAQAPVALARPLGPVTASVTVRSALDVREVPAGILVHDFLARQVVLMDTALAPVRMVADSTAATGRRYGRFPGRLMPAGDSTLFLDPGSSAVLVLGPDASVARVAAFPRPSEMGALRNPEPPGIDREGRVIYALSIGTPAAGTMATQGSPPGARPRPVDSMIVLRVDLQTRRVDTLARVAMLRPSSRMDLSDSVAPLQVLGVNPLAPVDGWVVLPGGTLAIVRGSDYHVDLVHADGRRESAPRIPFAWQRLTDEGKVAYLDSLRGVQDARAARGPGARGLTPEELGAAARRATQGEMDVAGVHYEYVDAAVLPDYRPAFRRGAVRADTQGRIWVRLTQRAAAGTLYDVLHGSGHRVDRVEIPEGRTIVGFGNGVVYLASVVDGGVLLERARER